MGPSQAAYRAIWGRCLVDAPARGCDTRLHCRFRGLVTRFSPAAERESEARSTANEGKSASAPTSDADARRASRAPAATALDTVAAGAVSAGGGGHLFSRVDRRRPKAGRSPDAGTRPLRCTIPAVPFVTPKAPIRLKSARFNEIFHREAGRRGELELSSSPPPRLPVNFSGFQPVCRSSPSSPSSWRPSSSRAQPPSPRPSAPPPRRARRAPARRARPPSRSGTPS